MRQITSQWNHFGRHKGVALVTVLLIVFLATVAATAMVSRQFMDVRHTTNIINVEQGYIALFAWEELAKRTLLMDTNNVDSFTRQDTWAMVDSINIDNQMMKTRLLSVIPKVGEFTVLEVQIEDLQGRFNLNNLAISGTSIHADRFARLLTLRGLPPELSSQTIDWVDADGSRVAADGADDDVYLTLDPPYLAANRQMTSASESMHLYNLRELSEEVGARRNQVGAMYGSIQNEGQPGVDIALTALPEETGINVNTVASPLVLQMIVPDLSDENARELYREISNRGRRNPYESVDEFLSDSRVNGQNKKNISERLVVSSDYFMLKIEAGNGRMKIYLNSILHRTGQGAGRTVQVIQRSFTKWGEI
ncbi:MAG: type II secretion system minor pseudopilin GspK [Gammaproteobacteria bacterium]|nr:type II secretion system minor pseudopilin GspK [Gammaproteobacteria bacterium]